MAAANSNAGSTLADRVCDLLEATHDEQCQRVARALHDGVAQALSAAVMNLALVERSGPALGGDAREAFDRAVALLTESCREVSELSHDLRPVFFGGRALGEGLRALLNRRFSNRRIDLTVGEGVVTDSATLHAAAAFVEFALGAYDTRAPVALEVYAERRQFSVRLSGEMDKTRDLQAILVAARRRVERRAGTLQVETLEPGGVPLRLVASFPKGEEDRGP